MAPAGIPVAADSSLAPDRSSGFRAGYRRSLKPLQVEEPIDVWVHRPLAYLLARTLLHTPVTPNAVTASSIACGLVAGASLLLVFPWHLQIAGAALFLSAILDCADGQLARMRGTSSALGRMLDGCADLVVSVAAVGGAVWVVWSKFHEPWWHGAVVVALAAATVVTGSIHTSTYDHFKNLYLGFTSPGYGEGEDRVLARRRYEQEQGKGGLGSRLAWPIYLFYLDRQAAVVRAFDPESTARLHALPGYDAERARIYEKHMGPHMQMLRNWFGFGSLVFGLALASALDVLEYYVLFRLVALNGLFYAWLRPRHRRASRAAFAEMGLVPPENVQADNRASSPA